jgi:hypothetical protein
MRFSIAMMPVSLLSGKQSAYGEVLDGAAETAIFEV